MSDLAKLSVLGDEIDDPDVETFVLFSQPVLSLDLGFVDSKAHELHLAVADQDLDIRQSPTLLSSDREKGTTGAVVWKVTPLLAGWLASDNNWLFQGNIINSESIVIELGCGISGIIAITMAPRIHQFICTDQEYVFKLLRENLENNEPSLSSSSSKSKQRKSTAAKKKASALGSINLLALDWESDVATGLSDLISHPDDAKQGSIDLVLACDCVFNEGLVEPFVQTCVDICSLRKDKSTVCLIAQQLRSDIVFDQWLQRFYSKFHVWRIPDELLTDPLRSPSGFVIHAGVLR